MADTPIEVRAPSGLTLTVDLFPYGNDTRANSAGDTLTEATNRRGLYLATISEALTGWHTVHVKHLGQVIAVYDIYLHDDTAIHRCQDALPRVVTVEAITSGVTLAASETIYPAEIQFSVDAEDTRDEYTVTWFENGTVITSGVTAPTIEVLRRDDGSALIASGTVLGPIGDSGALKHDETANRLAAGEAALVTVTATIDGATRSWRRILTREAQS